MLHVYNTCLMPGLSPRAGGGNLLWTWPLATFVGYKMETNQMIFLTGQHWHKPKRKHKKNGQVCSSCACAFAWAYVVALTSENRVDISTSISTRPQTNHRSLWPRPHTNISKAIWRTKCPPSYLSSSSGELVSRIESNMPFCACACPAYAYAYALVKPRL